MNREEALRFLADHQPLPPDSELTQSLIDIYNEVRLFFLDHPDTDCIRPFLNSFGAGNGLGVYKLIGDVFEELPPNNVVAELKHSLRSQQRSVRYWSAQIAALFPANDLLPMLQSLLRENDFDMKYAALTALEQIEEGAGAVLLDFLNNEKDPELRSLAQEILNQK
jgi:HEAT repeats